MNNIKKSLNDDKRLATFVVLEPQEDDGTTSDLHLDWYDEDTIEEACYNFNTTCMKANLMHMASTESFYFVESYITKSDMQLGESFVKKGSWLATIKVEADWVWEGIKEGKFNGLSVQCMATTEDMD